MAFPSFAHATSQPSIDVNCDIRITNIAGVDDQQVSKKIKLSGSQYTATGHQIVASTPVYAFKVAIGEVFSLGNDSEITLFYTEIINLINDKSIRSTSGVNYLNDSLRSASMTLIEKNTENNREGNIYFECSNYIQGPNILERMSK